MSKGHPQTPPNFDATLRCRSKRKPRRWVWSRTRGSSLSPSERERAEASRRRSRKCSMRKRRWSSGGGARGLAKARRVRRASLRMAGQEPPLRRPSDLPLRIRCHEAGQDADCGSRVRGSSLFASGLWTSGAACEDQKARRSRAPIELFGFLTTEPNAIVAPIHPKAMTVILMTLTDADVWLTADAPKALELQRPLPAHALRIVASGVEEMELRLERSARGYDANCARRPPSQSNQHQGGEGPNSGRRLHRFHDCGDREPSKGATGCR